MHRRMFSRFALLLVSVSIAASGQNSTPDGFRTLRIDAANGIGLIRSFQGLNGAPAPVIAGLPQLVRQYRELRVDQVRTHDLMGPTEIDSRFEFNNFDLRWLIRNPTERQEVVRTGNASIIFPDPSADPDNPASYNFGPTDKVLASIRESGAEIFYRVGRSWGANKFPPADFDKYAAVVKHVAMHYNQGWANGFHYGIRYWEFWNEPEGFWRGTPEQFYSLYEKTALALKSVDPSMKVGGDGRANPFDDGPFREGFVDYCTAHKLPLDFYSWHTYAIDSADPFDAVRLARQIRRILDAHGFPKAESILSEWNLTPDFGDQEKPELEGAHNAAYIGAVLTYFQDAPLDHAHFYRGDAAWMGLFDVEGNPFKATYVFKAMGKMQDTPMRLVVEGSDSIGFAALAGRSEDGRKIQIIISNYAIPAGYKPRQMELPPELKDPNSPPWDDSAVKKLPNRQGITYRDNAGYSLTVSHLPWGRRAFRMQRYRIDKTRNLDLVEERSGAGEIVNLSSALPTDSVELIILQRK